MKRGRCYERAAERLLRQKDARGWRLVHGFAVVSGIAPGKHAWLRLPDGRVWDPTENVYWPELEYTTNRRATPLRKYSQLQAARLMIKHDHYGPWYDEKTGWQAEAQFMHSLHERTLSQ